MFSDLPWEGVLASFDAARAICNDLNKLLDQVQTQFGAGFNRSVSAWDDTPQQRIALGRAAKNSEWFKRQSWANEWATAISPHLADPTIRESDFVRQLGNLRGWVDRV